MKGKGIIMTLLAFMAIMPCCAGNTARRKSLDREQAASMMAGHPGDVSLVNLRNTPFMVWCGALDSAYDRNAECTGRIAELEKCDYSRLILGLNDSIVNLDKPVTVRMNGRKLIRQKMIRSRACMEKTLRERQDARYAFDCELEVKIK